MQSEQLVEKPVEHSNTMRPKEFVMISSAFTDGVSLKKEGPRLTKDYSSECVLDSDRSYRTAASFIPKLVAKHFVTTLTVADEWTFFESIAFERQTVMQNFSETVNIYPKEKMHKYRSQILFERDSVKRHFIAGIELLPAQKLVVTEEELNYDGDCDATDCSKKGVINGDISRCQLINGGM